MDRSIFFWAPLRTISGNLTGLSEPIGIYVDAINNEIGVADPPNNDIAVFSRAADGNVPPLRTISGSATLLAEPNWIAVCN